MNYLISICSLYFLNACLVNPPIPKNTIPTTNRWSLNGCTGYISVKAIISTISQIIERTDRMIKINNFLCNNFWLNIEIKDNYTFRLRSGTGTSFRHPCLLFIHSFIFSVSTFPVSSSSPLLPLTPSPTPFTVFLFHWSESATPRPPANPFHLRLCRFGRSSR